jgi:hypothetical protein
MIRWHMRWQCRLVRLQFAGRRWGDSEVDTEVDNMGAGARLAKINASDGQYKLG